MSKLHIQVLPEDIPAALSAYQTNVETKNFPDVCRCCIIWQAVARTVGHDRVFVGMDMLRVGEIGQHTYYSLPQEAKDVTYLPSSEWQTVQPFEFDAEPMDV